MKSFFVFVILTLVLTGCEKVIELDLNEAASKLVIEGNITNQAGPYYVRLTKSVQFDAPSQYPAVENALVVMADNTGIKDTLTHTGNGVYRTNTIIGVEGRTYTVTVVADNNTFTASSTMPASVPLDSLRSNLFTLGGEEQNTVIPVFKDPLVNGNNYRFVMYVDDVLDQSYIVLNDNTENGAVNQRPIISNDIKLKTGNVVRIEMQCIDITSYVYYFTLAQMDGGGPGGGTTPSNPPNGISGGALGLFSAHTVQTKSIVIP